MRIVFLSDLHANFPALCRALDWAQRQRADRVICAGDIVGDGPHPTEVIRLLVEQRIEAILGNADRKVLALLEAPKKLERRLKKKTHAGSAWTALAMGERERAWLSGLPAELRLTVEGVPVRVVHGSPLSDTDYVFPSLTPAALAAKLGGERPALLVCGHSHIPFTRRVAGVRVVNCGTVGRPIDGDPRGSAALCEFLGDGRLRCRIGRFAYPVESVITDLEARRGRGPSPTEYRAGLKLRDR